MAGEAFIELRDVSFFYGEGTNREFGALSGINLAVAKGEFVVIIGHNGSGKSTLAKHLNALLVPTSGDVVVKGMNTRNEELLWQIRQSVGMVFQNPDNQIVATTVEEDVAFGPENLGLDPAEIRRRVDESLRVVGMDKFKNNAPHLLSGGQKQRVAIAGVIAMRPECIVLDEPTAMLDPVGRNEVMQTIRRLNEEEGITVIHITHFMEEAVAADRVVVMENGSIAFEGTPAQVFSRTEDLERLDLDVPQVVELASQLRRAGIRVSDETLTVEDMVEYLCRL